MGKYALMLALALSAGALVHRASTGDGVRESARQASEQQRLALARVAAKTGWSRSKQALANTFTGGTLTGLNGQATYEAQTVVTGYRARVTSTGSVPIPGRPGATDYTITYLLERMGGDRVPGFAEYAVLADGDLHFFGNGAVLESGVPGDSLSVRIHTNGSLTAGSSATRVEGFGAYTGSAGGFLSSTFQPTQNPDGAPVAGWADSVHVPAVVPSEIVAAYNGVGTVYSTTSSYWGRSLSGRTLPGGTRDSPSVYYVDGPVDIEDVTFDGYAVVVAEGDVSIKGTVAGVPDAGTYESALAVFTPGSVDMRGRAAIYASIVAGSELRYTGTVDVWGNVVVGGSFEHGGTARIHARPTSGTLYRTWNGGDPFLRLIAYREQ